MSDEVQRSLGRIEGDVKALRRDVTELRSDIGGLKKKTYAHSGVFSIIVAFITAKLTGGH